MKKRQICLIQHCHFGADFNGHLTQAYNHKNKIRQRGRNLSFSLYRSKYIIFHFLLRTKALQ